MQLSHRKEKAKERQKERVGAREEGRVAFAEQAQLSCLISCSGLYQTKSLCDAYQKLLWPHLVTRCAKYICHLLIIPIVYHTYNSHALSGDLCA